MGVLTDPPFDVHSPPPHPPLSSLPTVSFEKLRSGFVRRHKGYIRQRLIASLPQSERSARRTPPETSPEKSGGEPRQEAAPLLRGHGVLVPADRQLVFLFFLPSVSSQGGNSQGRREVARGEVGSVGVKVKASKAQSATTTVRWGR
jgi:hypothetical protein